MAGNPSGIPGDHEFSWRFEAGVERSSLACLGCRQFQISTGMGLSASPGRNQTFYGFLDFFGQAQRAVWQETSWVLAPHLGLLWEPMNLWKIRLDGGMYRSFSGPKKEYLKTRLHQRWTMAQNWDLRLEFDRMDEISEGILSVNFYW